MLMLPVLIVQMFLAALGGEPCRDRTGDPLLKRQMLYLLS